MKKYLYDIFATTSKNNCSDLTIGLAMFLADARSGKQEYGPDGLDYEALHKDYDALMDQEKELRLFMGRHHQKLAYAFRSGDRTAFEATIELCEAEDVKAAEAAEAEDAEADGSNEDGSEV